MEMNHFIFERGKTGSFPATTAVASGDYGDSIYKEGWTVRAKNINPSTGLERDKTDVILICLRNTTGSTLSGGDAVSFESGYRYRRAGSKVYQKPTTGVLGDIDAIVDDHYGSAAVPNGHLFWAVIRGQVLAYTSILATAENLIGVGDYLVPSAAANGAAAGAGKLAAADFTGAAQALAYTIKAARIRAMQAKTTSNTNTSILVEVNLGSAG